MEGTHSTDQQQHSWIVFVSNIVFSQPHFVAIYHGRLLVAVQEQLKHDNDVAHKLRSIPFGRIRSALESAPIVPTFVATWGWDFLSQV